MVIHQDASFRISSKSQWLHWFILSLLFISTIFIPFIVATAGQLYPDLNIVLTFSSATGFIWLMIVFEYGRHTAFVRLERDQFVVKKFLQRPERFPYSTINAYNEHLEVGKNGSFQVLTVYMADSYFIIKSSDFQGYEQLRDHLCQYGKSVPFVKVVTLSERNRIRWLTGGLALLIIGNIVFGYVAYEPIDKNPAQLISVIDVITQVRENRNKGKLTGVAISLRAFPNFSFLVSRKNYDVRLDGLKSAIAPERPVQLLIRASDFRKKLARTEALTIGDKYINYKQILVFGVEQGNTVHLQTPEPVYETTYTNPTQRAFLFGILLLFCWTGWVYIDRHKVIGAN